MDEYIKKADVLDYLNNYLHSVGEYNLLSDIGQRKALTTAIQDISAMKATDVKLVISGDSCIVCGHDVRKDNVYYDVNGGTICESCMNTKCKCKNGRDTEGKVTERNIEVSRPDGNCLDCKFQYCENSDYWCSICPGNPEDI